jgi:hypothetical protein
MEERKSWKEYTLYPKKYKGSYWGNFCSLPNPVIIQNRNKFIEEYNINKFEKHNSRTYKKQNAVIKPFERKLYFDHYELYSVVNSKSLIFVISPYCGLDCKEEIIRDGWEEIYQLYCNYEDCLTFIKIIHYT